MSEEYDEITAFHYAAYRPALHALILNRCIKDDAKIRSGLDVGCGTGHSTIALAEYCNSVIGIDPSMNMLNKAIQNPKITYFNGLLEDSKMVTDTFEIVTLAGVLSYSKSQKLYDEVVRVSKKGSQIIVYDFEVLTKSSFDILDIPVNKNSASRYNYNANFSGWDDGKLVMKTTVKDRLNLFISPTDLTHLVLSEKWAYENVKLKYRSKNVFESVQNILRLKSHGENLKVETNIFYSVYENIK